MSDNDEEVQHITAALEMVYRADREAVIFSYHDVGAALVPLLLRLLVIGLKRQILIMVKYQLEDLETIQAMKQRRMLD